MTTEELAAAGIPPAEREIRELKIAQPPEDNTSPAASGSENREDGEQKEKISEMSMLI
jgi:hypothetical protein